MSWPAASSVTSWKRISSRERRLSSSIASSTSPSPSTPPLPPRSSPAAAAAARRAMRASTSESLCAKNFLSRRCMLRMRGSHDHTGMPSMMCSPITFEPQLTMSFSSSAYGSAL